MKKVTTVVIVCFLACFLMTFLYFQLFQHCVVQATNLAFANDESVFFPLSLDGTVLERVTKAGSRLEAVNQFGPAEMSDKVTTMPGYAMARFWTQFVLLAAYESFVVLMVAAFCFILIYLQFHTKLAPPK